MSERQMQVQYLTKTKQNRSNRTVKKNLINEDTTIKKLIFPNDETTSTTFCKIVFPLPFRKNMPTFLRENQLNIYLNLCSSGSNDSIYRYN